MTAIDRYKNFFQRELKMELESPAILTVIALLSLQHLISRNIIKINAIPIDVFEKNTDVVNNFVKELNFKGYYFLYPSLYNALKEQPYFKKISEKNYRFDERLFNICKNRGDLYSQLYFILKSCGEELIKKNDSAALKGINIPIDFHELSSYVDKSLRPYQNSNKLNIYKQWQSKRSVMLQMPTGTGKTRLFVSIVNDVCKWAKINDQEVNILLLAHRKELISQISHNVGITYSIPHGIIMANNYEQKQYSVQIGSVPTLNVRLNNWKDKDFRIIIVDEAHHVKANSYNKILKAFPNAHVLGVTATPCRLNGASFHPEFDDIIVSPSVSKFIKEGYLCNYDYYSIRPESKLNKQIAAIKNYALDGDYLDSAMMEVMDQSSIRANILQTYLKYANGKKGIVYTINRQHNEHICERFIAAGIKAAAIDGMTPQKDRDKLVEDFRNGDIQVLCNVNIFSEGFDCPDVEFIQLARPTKSLAMFLQQVGRGLRISNGKSKVLFLDNVGLYNRFGFPSARRHWKHHFEGKYENEEDERLKNFSVEESEDIKLNYIDEYEEGEENVDLLHTSEIEDPLQIDEYGYIKDFDSYIENTMSKAVDVIEKQNILANNIKILEDEARIFRKYKVEVPSDITQRIEKLQNCKDDIIKKDSLTNVITELNWRDILQNMPSPFNAKTIKGVMNRIYPAGYHININSSKNSLPDVKIVERKDFFDETGIGFLTEKERIPFQNLNLTVQKTFVMLKQNMTDFEIANKRGLPLMIISSHIELLISIKLINVELIVNKEIKSLIENAIELTGASDINTIYDKIHGKASYSEIRYVLASLKSIE